LLETANIQLSSVATDVFGVSRRLMLRALIEGKATPQAMAELAKRRLRNKIPELELALKGRVEETHRFLLKLQLERLESVEKGLETLEQRIQEKLKPYAAQLALLKEIPGVDWTRAAVYDNFVYAVKASTGAGLWAADVGDLVRSSPTVANGVVYVGSDTACLVALKASTGGYLWQYCTGSNVTSSAAVANGVVYVGSWESKVHALNASTGALLWSYTTGGSCADESRSRAFRSGASAPLLKSPSYFSFPPG
jgi:hypothetical protein